MGTVREDKHTHALRDKSLKSLCLAANSNSSFSQQTTEKTLSFILMWKALVRLRYQMQSNQICSEGQRKCVPGGRNKAASDV